MPARCQPPSTPPAFLPNPTKGPVRASSAGSAAPCAASSLAASRSPAACDARLRRNPAATLPRPETWRRRPRPGDRAPRAGSPFTPEAYPGLSAEACAIFNTPVEKCDSDILRLVLAALALHIADAMPPELGMTDAKAVFSSLWGRLGADPGEARPDAPPAEAPTPAPATPKDAEPDAPGAPKEAEPDAPDTPDAPLIQAPGPEPAGDAPVAAAAWETTPDAASRTGSVFRPGRALFD